MLPQIFMLRIEKTNTTNKTTSPLISFFAFFKYKDQNFYMTKAL